jgi:hypothetical protein
MNNDLADSSSNLSGMIIAFSMSKIEADVLKIKLN